MLQVARRSGRNLLREAEVPHRHGEIARQKTVAGHLKQLVHLRSSNFVLGSSFKRLRLEGERSRFAACLQACLPASLKNMNLSAPKYVSFLNEKIEFTVVRMWGARVGNYEKRQKGENQAICGLVKTFES